MVAVNSANYDDSLCSHDGAVSAKDTEVVHIRQSGCFTLRKGEESLLCPLSEKYSQKLILIFNTITTHSMDPTLLTN